MKRLFLTLAALVAVVTLSAQTAPKEDNPKGPYEFTDVKEAPVTPVRDQSSSGTCWSFSGLGFLESELIRQGKGEYDLAEMWIVRHTYIEKAKKYVRMHGKAEFSAGGATHDVFDMINKYGIVPEEVYGGLEYGTQKHKHAEMDAALKGYVDAIVKNPNGTITPNWIKGVEGILDTYLGEAPEKFTYKGKEYTPKSFAESLGLNMDDYVSFVSFTHHPFYTEFAIEVPDNWAWGMSWNVPLDEFMRIVDSSVEMGYAIDWASDVSEEGFIYMKGFAVVPDDMTEDAGETEISRWVRMSKNQRQALVMKATEPIKELEITQEIRQIGYDNYQTTDDHGMVITGYATDQNGNRFYKVKNSWDTNQVYEGYFYASVPFVSYKTMNIVVHKDVIPKDIKKKLGIK